MTPVSGGGGGFASVGESGSRVKERERGGKG